MAFINEKLTDEQRDEYEARCIKFIGEYWAIRPMFVTIDKERNITLIENGEDKDSPNDKRFILIRDDGIYCFYVSWLYENETRIWNLSSKNIYYSLLEDKYVNRELILNDLRDALRVFNINGRPNDEYNSHNSVVGF